MNVRQLAYRFGVKDMLREPKDDVFMASLFYYLDGLTLGG